MADLTHSVVTSRRISRFSQAYFVGFLFCMGGSALGEDISGSAGGFLSSLKQAFNHDFDHDVVRGHFDVGTPPDTHRYYCLVDAKTGKREANGVGGQPVLRPDGMTTIKSGAVSFYSCDNAERQGNLVTAGYPLIPGAGAEIPRAGPAPAQHGQAPINTASPSPDRIDVAGVRLGMTPDQVRTVLKSKNLLDYHESAQSLDDLGSAGRAARSMTDRRFVNVIAAWTAPMPASAGDRQGGESYEVMFTPVPGRERVMAIVHSAAYAAANAVSESMVEHALVTKYGGYSGTDGLPASPMWRFQSGGGVLVGDSCNRRAIFGGLSQLNVGAPARQNIALTTTAEEFRYQIDRCGVAIVTEDHSTLNSNASTQDRLITQFTVTAYSPSIGFDGASAAMQLIQAAGKGEASRIQPAPDL
ncbi:MAG TPA: hypothetical protein VGO37_20535 [Steroidobacteraceae bacterium]|jgi:hypothetical protein|nr:hypothetical protein [Steroidobacteraceae bacterium]